jgi:hypothetical protein
LRQSPELEPLEDRRLPAGSLSGLAALYFEPNLGQARADADFLVRGDGYTMLVNERGATFSTPAAQGEPSTFSFLRANRSAIGTGGGLQAGISNYVGSRHSLTGVPHFAEVTYENLYPGIDVTYYGNSQGRLEYDFIVEPGAAVSAIRIAFTAVGRPKIDKAGSLVVETAQGTIIQHAPRAYQEINGVRHEVASRWKRVGDQATLRVGGYDHSRPLIIDPTLGFSTYLGGTADDEGLGIAVDGDGNNYVTGWTKSLEIPPPDPPPGLPPPGGGPSRPSKDVFVAKLSQDGQELLYVTYLVGMADDVGRGIAVGNGGEVWVAGSTESTDFVTTEDAFLETPIPGVLQHGFLTKLLTFRLLESCWVPRVGRPETGTARPTAKPGRPTRATRPGPLLSDGQ